MKFNIAFVILITVLLSASFAQAVYISGPNYANLCQCEQIKQKFSICSQVPGFYSVSTNLPQESWFLFAPSVVDLTNSTCADVSLFITPNCYASSGEYIVPLVINGPEKLIQDYSLVVRQCHLADLDVNVVNMSIKQCEVTRTGFVLKNNSAFTESFVLSQKGLPDNWVNYTREKIVLAPFSSFSGTLEVKSPCNADSNLYPFQLIATNTMTNYVIAKNISFSVLENAPFTIGKLFSDSSKYIKNFCEENDSEESFVVKSTSLRPDTIKLFLLDANKVPLSESIAVFDKNLVSIDANKSTDIVLNVKKGLGTVTGFIRAYSTEYDKNFDAGFELKFDNCFDVTMARRSNELKQCFSSRNEGIVITNTGTFQSSITAAVSVNGELIKSESLILEKNESRNISFIISPKLTGVSNIRVKVSSQYFTKDLNYDFDFENCYNLAVNVSNIKTCSGLSIDHVFDVENKGTRTQSVLLSTDASWLSITPSSFVLDSNSKRDILVRGEVPSGFSKTYKLIASSKEQEVEQSINISDSGFGVCYDFSAVLSKYEIDANHFGGDLVDLNITNTGFFRSVYNLTKISNSLVTLSEENFSLYPNESKLMFVHVSFDSNIKDIQNAKIMIVNDKNVSKELLLKINPILMDPVIDANQMNLSVEPVDLNRVSGLAELKLTLKNDSNNSFVLNDILINDLNIVVDLNKNTYLASGAFLVARFFVPHDVNSTVHDANALFVIVTSIGDFNKPITFSLMPNGKSLTLTSFFAAYSMPFIEGLLIILLILVLLALRSIFSKRKDKGGGDSGNVSVSPSESTKAS